MAASTEASKPLSHVLVGVPSHDHVPLPLHSHSKGKNVTMAPSHSCTFAGLRQASPLLQGEPITISPLQQVQAHLPSAHLQVVQSSGLPSMLHPCAIPNAVSPSDVQACPLDTGDTGGEQFDTPMSGTPSSTIPQDSQVLHPAIPANVIARALVKPTTIHHHPVRSAIVLQPLVTSHRHVPPASKRRVPKLTRTRNTPVRYRETRPSNGFRARKLHKRPYAQRRSRSSFSITENAYRCEALPGAYRTDRARSRWSHELRVSDWTLQCRSRAAEGVQLYLHRRRTRHKTVPGR